jgi:hypothetical protein
MTLTDVKHDLPYEMSRRHLRWRPIEFREGLMADDKFQVEPDGDERYTIKHDGEVRADVLWHEVENTDPDADTHGGYWLYAPTSGADVEWRDIPRDDAEQAVERAKSRIEDDDLTES